MVPAAITLMSLAGTLRIELSVYDGGLFLTLARNLGLSRLPYRDMWTLYGPGPPIVSSVVMDVFGRGLAPQRFVLFLVHALVVTATFLVARRFVSAWPAAALAAFAAAVGIPFHFEQTVVFLLWGLWFVLRASDAPERAARRLGIAALLFGLSFWGRFEFLPVGVLLVVGLWLFARDRVEEHRRVLWMGLAAPLLFLLYLLAVVGPERAWLNLVEYPFFRYSDQACRGIPAAWPAALDALAGALELRLWRIGELMLWTATFLAPLLGIGALLVARARRHVEPYAALAAAACGGLLLILWLEHRPRASESPYALVPMMVLSAAVLLGALVRRRPTPGRWTSAAVATLLLLTLANSWVRPALQGWTDWPTYHPLLGWEGERLEGLYDRQVWSEVASAVRLRTAPGEEIFVALIDNRTHFANAPIFYWYADRPPASRFVEFDPCLTDTAPIQREIVGDLASVDVVVATSFFTDLRKDPATGPTELKDYLGSRFETVYRGSLPHEQAVLVLQRRVPNH